MPSSESCPARATPTPPDCDKSPATPGWGRLAAKVASRPMAGTATPKQLGPTSRMPCLRHTASRSAQAAASRPDAITTSDRTPRWPHCSATPSTAGAGTATTARSAGSGRSSTEARHRSPSICRARGFTVYRRPAKPPARMFSRMTRPIDSRRRLAPITTTDSGASRCRRLATSALLSRSATALR